MAVQERDLESPVDLTADWEWGKNHPSDITISALQRGTWQSKDGKIVKIFVNVSDQTINFKTSDSRTGKMKKKSLAPFNHKIIDN